MQPTLLVLAAGMGSRYGGLKQLDPMGPAGETLLDYSIRDAIAAGFEKIVFVIRRDFAEAFRERIGARHAGTVEIDYAFQSLDDLPAGFTLPEGRTKPWGTAHAIRAARQVVNNPFVAINADDYYGADAYQRIVEYIRHGNIKDAADIAMVGYPIRNTLSPNGSVNRGVCTIRNGLLQSVEEHIDIRETSAGIHGKNLAGELVKLSPEALVSMNFWAFSTAFFDALETHFTAFLRDSIQEPKAECYIPSVVDSLIKRDGAQCEVLPTTGAWFGVTYPEDKPEVQRRLQVL